MPTNEEIEKRNYQDALDEFEAFEIMAGHPLYKLKSTKKKHEVD